MSTSGVSEQEVQRFTNIFDGVFDEETIEALDDIDVLESATEIKELHEVSTLVVTEHEAAAWSSNPISISNPSKVPAEADTNEIDDEQSVDALLLDSTGEIVWPTLMRFFAGQVKLSLISAQKLKPLLNLNWFSMVILSSFRIWKRTVFSAMNRSRNVSTAPLIAVKASTEASEVKSMELTRRASGSQWLLVGAVAGAAIFGVNHGVLNSFTGASTQAAEAAALRDPAALVSDTIAKAKIWFQEKQSFTGFVAEPSVQIAAGGPIIIITAGEGTYCSFAGIAPQYSTVVKLDPTGAHCDPVRIATFQAQLNDL